MTPTLLLLKVAAVLVLLHSSGAKYEEGHLVTPEVSQLSLSLWTAGAA